MEDFLAESKKRHAEIERADAGAKAKQTMVGRYVTHPVADGRAYYLITRVSKLTARVEWIDIDDGYVVAAWGKTASVPLKTIRSMLTQRDGLTALFGKLDDWWTAQKLGSTVHYSNGFNQFVRGVIVVHEGKKQMMPTALVGAWGVHDLPRRQIDGTLTVGYHGKKIFNKEPMQPSASLMVEYPEFHLRGEHPRDLPVVDLSVPEIAPEQEKLARLVALRQNVLTLLNVSPTGDTKQMIDAISRALVTAGDLLAQHIR